MTARTRPLVGIGFALMAACGYGVIPPLVRLAYQNGIPAPESTFFRTSMLALVFAIVTAALGLKVNVPKGAMPGLVAQAASTAVISIAYLASVEFIPVGLAVIIFFTFPVIILITAPLVEGTVPGWGRTAIAMLAFCGLVLAIGPGFDALDWRGIALASSAAIGGVVQFYSGRALSARLSPVVFSFLGHLMIWPVSLAVALWWSGGVLRFFPGGGATGLGYAALFGLGTIYVVNYFVHMQSLSFAPASVVAPFFNLEPVTTTLVAAFLLGERLSANQYAGGGLVLVALIAAGLEGKAKRMWLARRTALEGAVP